MTHLVAIEGMENLNTSETTDFGGMFAGCSSLKSIDLSGFDTGKALYMSNMFNGCSSLTDIDVSGFKTDNVRRYNYMFYGCSGLKRLDISNFSFAKAKYAELMLNGCTALTELNVGSLDFSNVTTSNRNGEAFDGVGTADSPCTLKVNGDFATSQLGDRLTNGQGVGYYSWLGGYFTEPVTDTPTAVDKVASDMDVDAPRYNLSGQRVGKGYKGVVVVNGRKLVVK